MPTNPNAIPRNLFKSVKEAREAFKAKADKFVAQYELAIDEAIKNKDFEAATKAIQWALEHMASDDDGTKIIDIGIDRPKGDNIKTGPQINIGFQLGGISQPKAIEAIDVKALPAPTDQATEAEIESEQAAAYRESEGV